MEADQVQHLKCATPTTTAKPEPSLEAVAHRRLANTRSIRLLTQLVDWRCPVCDSCCPDVQRTMGSVRYIQCIVCGARSKIVVA